MVSKQKESAEVCSAATPSSLPTRSAGDGEQTSSCSRAPLPPLRTPLLRAHGALPEQLAAHRAPPHALAARRAVDRKEFFETWEFFARVRGSLRGTALVDVAGGHGLLAALFAIFEAKRFPRVLVADTRQPRAFDAVRDATAEVAPWAVDKLEYVAGEEADSFALGQKRDEARKGAPPLMPAQPPPGHCSCTASALALRLPLRRARLSRVRLVAREGSAAPAGQGERAGSLSRRRDHRRCP